MGAFIKANSDIRYLCGGLSLSNSYSEDARNMIVYFYRKWFHDNDNLSAARHKFCISQKSEIELEQIFCSNDYNIDLRVLKNRLKLLGYSIPTLYKQYSELCDPGRVKFLDFGVAKDFQNCIDALILVDVTKIKESKKERCLKSDRTLKEELSLLQIA